MGVRISGHERGPHIEVFERRSYVHGQLFDLPELHGIYVHDIFVPERVRRHNIGRTLLRQLVDVATQHGADDLQAIPVTAEGTHFFEHIVAGTDCQVQRGTLLTVPLTTLAAVLDQQLAAPREFLDRPLDIPGQ